MRSSIGISNNFKILTLNLLMRELGVKIDKPDQESSKISQPALTDTIITTLLGLDTNASTKQHKTPEVSPPLKNAALEEEPCEEKWN